MEVTPDNVTDMISMFAYIGEFEFENILNDEAYLYLFSNQFW